MCVLTCRPQEFLLNDFEIEVGVQKKKMQAGLMRIDAYIVLLFEGMSAGNYT